MFKNSIRRHSEIHMSIHSDRHDIDAVSPANINLTDTLSLPSLRYGNLEYRVFLIKFDVVKNVIGTVSDRCPLRDLLFRVDHFIRTVPEQELGLHFPVRAGYNESSAEFLEQRCRFK